MLDSAWIIPALPAVSFLVILFFGKRLPKQGAEVGILAVGASFVLSIVTTVEWINRVNDANSGEHGLSAFFGRGVVAAARRAHRGRGAGHPHDARGGRAAASRSVSAPTSTAWP